MIRILILMLGLMAFVGDVRADYNATPKSFNCNQSGKIYDNQNTACQYLSSSISTPIPYSGGAQSATPTGSYPGPYGCLATYSNSATSQMTCTNAWTCPYGGTLNGTRCIGADPPPSCPPGKTAVYTWQIIVDSAGHVISGPPIIGSDGQCEIKIVGVRYCYLATDGNSYCKYDTVTTGNIRVPSPPGIPSANNNPPSDSGNTAGSVKSNPIPGDKTSGACPKGTVNAGVDSSGIPICIGTGYDRPSTTTPTTTTTSPSTTTNNADGSTTTTQSKATTNADGTTTTVTTTTITKSDGSTTQTQTSQTSTKPDGTVGVSGSSTDKSNLCSQNPNLTICQNSTVAGDCTAGFSCTGDAIQCATLRAAAAMQCKQQADSDEVKVSSLATLGSAVSSGADPQASSLPSVAGASNVAMPTMDQSGWLGAGAFFPDKTFTVQGRTITIPFSNYGQYLVVFRYAMMVVALLVSFKILSGAVIRE